MILPPPPRPTISTGCSSEGARRQRTESGGGPPGFAVVGGEKLVGGADLDAVGSREVGARLAGRHCGQHRRCPRPGPWEEGRGVKNVPVGRSQIKKMGALIGNNRTENLQNVYKWNRMFQESESTNSEGASTGGRGQARSAGSCAAWGRHRGTAAVPIGHLRRQ